MRLRYTFDILELDDSFIAVPVGKSAEEFSGVLKLNSSAKKILDLLDTDITEEKICESLCKEYPGQEECIKQYIIDVISKLRGSNIIEE